MHCTWYKLGLLGTALLVLGVTLLSLLSPAPPVEASDGVPFKGRITGTLVQKALSNPPVNWSVTITGTGNATLLGNVGVVITNADVGLGDGILVPDAPDGVGTFTAPNGDKVFGVYKWTAFPTTTPEVLAFQGTFTITGGEGRFVGATGGGTFSGTGDILHNNLVVATFDGTISPPGKNG